MGAGQREYLLGPLRAALDRVAELAQLVEGIQLEPLETELKEIGGYLAGCKTRVQALAQSLVKSDALTLAREAHDASSVSHQWPLHRCPVPVLQERWRYFFERETVRRLRAARMSSPDVIGRGGQAYDRDDLAALLRNLGGVIKGNMWNTPGSGGSGGPTGEPTMPTSGMDWWVM